MEIGEKIRELRLSKMMTQADLAGDQITRNMLCTIERGAALPSLPTAIYLAGRLGVPVGYLLADDGDEFAYRKMTGIANVRRAFASGDFSGCLSVLSATFGEQSDDELSLIRAECEYGLARQAFSEGHLRVAVAAFDRALLAADKTAYRTDWMRGRIAVYLRAMAEVSPTLTSDVLEESEVSTARAVGDPFCEYVLALEAMRAGRMGEVEHYLACHRGDLGAERIAALCLMEKEHYEEARAICERLLLREDLGVGVLMYDIFGDMEQCCRHNDAYKRAYEFSCSRLEVLERLLEEA